MRWPQVRPRACTSTLPSLSFPSLTVRTRVVWPIRHGGDRVLVVARQKGDPVAALDDRIGSEGGRNQVIETFHELSAGERLRNECGGRQTLQFLRWDWKRVRR